MIGVVGVLVGIMLAKPSSTSSSTTEAPPQDAPTYESSPTYEEPSPSPLPTLSAEEVDSLVRGWQDIKREALLNLDGSRLEEALTDKALKDMRGAIEWESDPSHQEKYHGIELISLNVDSFEQVDDYTAHVSVTIEEVKAFELRGQCKRTHSRYTAVYNLQRLDAGWRISDIPQDQIQTLSKEVSGCE